VVHLSKFVWVVLIFSGQPSAKTFGRCGKMQASIRPCPMEPIRFRFNLVYFKVVFGKKNWWKKTAMNEDVYLLSKMGWLSIAMFVVFFGCVSHHDFFITDPWGIHDPIWRAYFFRWVETQPPTIGSMGLAPLPTFYHKFRQQCRVNIPVPWIPLGCRRKLVKG